MTEVITAQASPAFNRYDPAHKIVFLDNNLKDYPDAWRHVIDHEMTHAVNDQFKNWTTLRDVYLDLHEDWCMAFSSDPVYKQLREYYREAEYRDLSLSEFMGALLWNQARGFISLSLGAAGWLYRRLTH